MGPQFACGPFSAERTGELAAAQRHFSAGTASVEAGRARHSVRAETGLCDERRAQSDAPYLG
jgi:hypothetical protein